MKILIIRHGDPDYEHDSLTQTGIREAEILSQKLKNKKLDAIYVSPFGRARLTAKPTLEKLNREEVICEWLREFSYPITLNDGSEKGLPWDFLPADWTADEDNLDYRKWLETDVMKSGAIKEKVEHVTTEFDKLLAKHGYERDGYLYHAVKPNTDTIVFFCHFGLECVLLGHLLNMPVMPLWHGTVALPTSVTTLCTEEREEGKAYFRMSNFGDVSHLTAAGEEPSFSARFCEVYSDFSQRH